VSELEQPEAVVETERLVLRYFEVADAPFILRLLNEPAFLRFIGDRGVRALEDAEAYITRGPLDSYRRFGFGLLLVELKVDRKPIGMCGLMQKPWLASPDIAYAFVPEMTGEGYGIEAARAVLHFGCHRLKLDRVLGVVIPDNTASIRLLEKLGFRAEGTIADPSDGAELRLYAFHADRVASLP
jgi:RimJ/RimL family protein N-acetyltransferase